MTIKIIFRIILERLVWIDLIDLELRDLRGGRFCLFLSSIVERGIGVPRVIRRLRDIDEEFPTTGRHHFPSTNPGDQRRFRRLVLPAERRDDLLRTKAVYRIIGRER